MSLSRSALETPHRLSTHLLHWVLQLCFVSSGLSKGVHVPTSSRRALMVNWNPFSDLVLQIVFCKIVLSVAVSDVTASTCCHSLLFFLLFTPLLWPQNNITCLCYISPTSTPISLSVMLFFFYFFFFFSSDMTHRSVPLVRGLNALTLNFHEVLCIDHLWLKVGM